MLCEICKNNEANIHVTKIINGVKQEMNMCEKCARENDEFNIDMTTPFTFQNILSGIVDYMNQGNAKGNALEPVCNNCGTTYGEFKKTGLLGCSKCYETFNRNLLPIVKRVQLNVDHAGKIPKKMGKDMLKKRRLIQLKEELNKAIATEEYERAAVLRDEIKQLQNNEK